MENELNYNIDDDDIIKDTSDNTPELFTQQDYNKIDEFIKMSEKKEKLNNAKTKLQESETKHYDAIQKQKEKQRKAIEALLKHTSGNIPALFNEVNTVLKGIMAADKKLEFDKPLNFSEETASFRIPKFAESFNLDGATDFFGMNIAEQELLFDRIGLFKGIVVDHSKETPVEQGFRNAVKYLKKDKKNNEDTKPVNVFYKKPRLSGFFETNYSLDEGQKKSQEAGIFNLGFGLSVDVSTRATSVAVRAGFSYGKDQLHEKNTHFKKVSIISNFFLPKIELSFDTLIPCADDNLVSHLERVFAIQNINDLQRFEEVNKLLYNFGHFVPTSLVIGGRLYSSDTKEIKTEESIDNVMTKYAANFQLGVSTRIVEVGIEAKMSKEDSEKVATKTASERQNLQLNAIGGEGAFVNDTSKWVKSTEKYTSWGLVRFDNLVPIIDILPKELKQKCNSLFDAIVTTLSIEEILERNAHFLFYKGYLERFGKNAQPKFYLIKNNLTDTNVLSISSDTDIVNFKEVVLKPYERKDSQLWYASPAGKIYSKEKYDTNNKFVLSLENDKAVITMEDYFDNQFWSVGGGIIKNENLNKFLVGKDKTAFKVEEGNDSAKKSAWLLVSEKEFDIANSKKKSTTNTTLKTIENKADTIKDGEYCSIKTIMESNNCKVELTIKDSNLNITSKDLIVTDKTLWKYELPKGTERIALVDGKLIAQNNSGEYLQDIINNSSYIYEIKLLNNGNFEAIDRAGTIVWESKSIIYSTIKKSGSNEVLSVHHCDFEPNMSYAIICLTTYPFVEADHQLWYINRNNQIVCKSTYSGKQFALTSDQNGSVTLNALKSTNNSDQKWKIDSNGYGIIENQANSKRLKSAEYGMFVSADNVNEDWEIISKPALYGKSKIAKIKKPTLKHDENTDYCSFFNSGMPSFIHNDTIDLNGNALSGLRIIKYENRYALEIETRNKSNNTEVVKSSTWDPYFNGFEKSKAEFQKSVLYLEDGIESIGLNFISNDKFGIKYIKNGTVVTNSYSSFVKMEDNNDKIKFVDLNWVRADNKEKVVAIGLGIFYNRIAPYILTIPT